MMGVIEHRQAELDSLFQQYAGEPAPVAPLITSSGESGDLTQADIELVAKIRRSRQGSKFDKLYDGDFSGYQSQSEADLALCQILAFWTGKDSEQMDHIFCQTKLYRPKWDEKHGQLTYGQLTIQKAIAGTDKVYGEGQAKKSINRPLFELVRAGMIEAKAPQWLIPGYFERDSLALLFGDPGCGKSFLAIDIALCVATGTLFHGHLVKQGPVIYIAGEGQNGLKRRMMAWSVANKVNHDTAPLFISRRPAALTDADILAAVQAAIDEVSPEHGPPALIVIDTLARNFGPGDENQTKDMSEFIQAVDALRAGCQATVLVVHHTGHGEKGRARGAMALKGALDAEFRLDRDDVGVVRMVATKMKDSKYPEPTAYRIESVTLPLFDEDGATVSSAVLVPTSYEPLPQKGKVGQGKHQKRALEILKELQNEERGFCETEGRDPATARVSMDDWKRAMKKGGVPQQRVAEVVASLRALNMITEGGGFVSLL